MTDTEPTTNPAKRGRWPAGVATITGILLLAAIFIWQTRLVMAERALSWFIADQGLGPASMNVTRLDLSGAQVNDMLISYGSIREISITFSLKTLLRGRAQRLSIEGADLTIKQKKEKDTAKTSGKPPPRAPAQDFSGVTLPIDTVSVRQIQVHLETELGSMALSLDGDLGGVSETSGEIRIVAQMPFGEASGTVQASLDANSLITFEFVTEATSVHRSAQGRGKITARGTWDLPTNRLELAEGRAETYDLAIGDQISFPGNSILEIDGSQTWISLGDGAGAVKLAPFSLTSELAREGEYPLVMQFGAASLRATLTPDGEDVMLVGGWAELSSYDVAASGVEGKASRIAHSGIMEIGAKINRFRHTRSPAFVAPLMVEMDVLANEDEIEFAANVRSPNQHLQTKIAGSYHSRLAAGTAQLNLNPLDLEAEGGIQTLFPITSEWITSAKGKIDLEGNLNWAPESTRAGLSVTLDKIAMMNDGVGVTDIQGALRFNNVTPPSTPPGQSLTAVVVVPKMEPIPINLSFQLEPGHIRIDKAAAEILGGGFEVANASFDANTGKGNAHVSVNKIDLALISNFIDLDEFDGTGKLSGVVPMRIKGERVAIDGGRLRTTEPGIIRIGSKLLTDQLGNTGDSVDLTLQALSDFHYRELMLELEKPLSGEGSVLAHMDGSNPAVLEDHPFVFNIRLSADFDKVTKVMTDAADIAGKALGWGLNQ